eukprot:1146952-Pelagomonas_calceolata.AAC.5
MFSPPRASALLPVLLRAGASKEKCFQRAVEECTDPDCRRSLRALADTFALNCIMKDVIFRCARNKHRCAHALPMKDASRFASGEAKAPSGSCNEDSWHCIQSHAMRAELMSTSHLE